MVLSTLMHGRSHGTLVPWATRETGLMTEAGQVAGGGLEARVNEWLRDLAAKGLIVAEGDGYRLGDACDNG